MPQRERGWQGVNSPAFRESAGHNREREYAERV